MANFWILGSIKKPKEEIGFLYTKQRPFTASIWKRRKERQKYRVRTITKTCSKCGHVTQKPIYKTRILWSAWKTIKSKECRNRKRAMTIAERWYKGYMNRKPRAIKVIFT